jgi:hypothetical protein
MGSIGPAAPARKKSGPIRAAVLGAGLALLFAVVVTHEWGSGPVPVLSIADPRNVELRRAAAAVLAGDPRNKGVDFRLLRNGDRLTFDLQGVSTDKAPLDVMRVLLQTAQALKEKRYNVVELRFRNAPRFLLPGTAFAVMGAEYTTQNPVYTIRTFPEKLTNPDGSRAFPKWEGGLLGVTGKQMEEVMEVHKRWYLNELAGVR